MFGSLMSRSKFVTYSKFGTYANFGTYAEVRVTSYIKGAAKNFFEILKVIKMYKVDVNRPLIVANVIIY